MGDRRALLPVYRLPLVGHSFATRVHFTHLTRAFSFLPHKRFFPDKGPVCRFGTLCGGKIEYLKTILKRTGKNHALALELFDSGTPAGRSSEGDPCGRPGGGEKDWEINPSARH